MIISKCKKNYVQEWQEASKKVETSLKKQTLFDHVINDNIPPVRGSNCSVPIQVKEVTSGTLASSGLKPRAFDSVKNVLKLVYSVMTGC